MTATTIRFEDAIIARDEARAAHKALRESMGLRRSQVLSSHMTAEQWDALKSSAQRVSDAEAALLASE